MKKSNLIIVSEKAIAKKIYWVRNKKVMFDSDLALLYGVPTGALIQAVKRKWARFPEDFVFRLDEIEHNFLRSQIGVGSINSVDTCYVNSLLFL